MKYEANVYQMTVDGRTFWIADSRVLKGCTGQGETSAEAILELEENEEVWLQTARQTGIAIPKAESRVPFSYKGKIALRIAPNVHAQAADLAEKLGISLNQYLSNAIMEYNMEVKQFLHQPDAQVGEGEYLNRVLPFSQKRK